MKAPKQVALNCINYWLDNLPDMSDKPTFNPKNISTLGRGKKDRRRLHCHLSGLVGRWVNITIDWAISLGLWAVQFIDKDGGKTNLVEMFSTAVWIRYVSLMCGKPTFKSNAAQKIFRYMIVFSCYYFLMHLFVACCACRYLLANPRLVAKTWRGRLYFYSSGTIFNVTTSKIRAWLEEDPKANIPKLRKVRVYVFCVCVYVYVNFWSVCIRAFLECVYTCFSGCIRAFLGAYVLFWVYTCFLWVGVYVLFWVGVYVLFWVYTCLLYTSPSPRDRQKSRMPSSA